MDNYFNIYIYFSLVCVVTFVTFGATFLFASTNTSAIKFMPYESGMLIQTNLLQERFPVRHYLVGLIFLVFDVEVVFLYPWAVVAKSIGPFAFCEMLLFLLFLSVGFIYVWKKGGLAWE